MLPRKNRPNRRSIASAVKRGKRTGSKHITLITHHLSRHINKSKPQFAFVVSQRVAKKATTRNLLKRRARYIIRNEMSLLKNNPNNIFYFRKESNKLTFQELKKEIINLLRKANVYKKSNY